VIGVERTQILSVSTSAGTPGKIRRLTKKLEKIERTAQQLNKSELNEQLANARRSLDAIERDLDPEEATVLKKTLPIETIPLPRQRPSERVAKPRMKHPARAERPKPARKLRIRYHNIVSSR
jgi:hypothetical protein